MLPKKCSLSSPLLLLLLSFLPTIFVASYASAVTLKNPVDQDNLIPLNSSINWVENTAEKLQYFLPTQQWMAKKKPKPFVQAGPPEFIQYVPPNPFVQAGPPEFAQYLPPTQTLQNSLPNQRLIAEADSELSVQANPPHFVRHSPPFVQILPPERVNSQQTSAHSDQLSAVAVYQSLQENI